MSDGRPDFRKKGIIPLGRQFFYTLRTKVDDDYRIPFPGHREFDAAVHAALAAGGIPFDISHKLNFSDLFVGLRCFELSDMVAAAQEASIIQQDGDGHLRFSITRQDAEEVLREYCPYPSQGVDLLAERVIAYLAQHQS